MTAENPNWRQQCLPGRDAISACSQTESDMDMVAIPLRKQRSDQPSYLTEQPASRTRFYRDKRNGKIMGICAGIADYTGFDVSLVRVCFLAAVFLSGGGILPFYFIAAMVTPDQAARARAAWTGRRSSSGRAFGHRRHEPLATSAHASRTSIAGWPTSKAT